ncbi:uncharacterized protein G2W53_009574 [Senna tora]|uniref:Uncharacterized protein n=1 Tax=Senna tora TaxID=362788 RepID=A0A834WYI1_9FABA|nr:uncharacterized protein G2W53_009574 [Senna tora]
MQLHTIVNGFVIHKGRTGNMKKASLLYRTASKTSEIKNYETAHQQLEKKKSNRCKSCNKKVGLTGFHVGICFVGNIDIQKSILAL